MIQKMDFKYEKIVKHISSVNFLENTPSKISHYYNLYYRSVYAWLYTVAKRCLSMKQFIDKHSPTLTLIKSSSYLSTKATRIFSLI